MDKNEQYIKTICDGFQKYYGKASAYCFMPFKFEDVIYKMIALYRNKRPDTQILIITDNYSKILKIAELLRINNIDNTNIKMLTDNYINKNRIYTNNFIIFIDVNDIDIIERLTSTSVFTFALFTENKMNTNFNISIDKILPKINTNTLNNEALKDRINSPVEEYHIGVFLSDKDRIQYDKYTEFVKESMSIFGDFATIEKCRLGDIKNNISATYFRERLAYMNGWKNDLDTSVPFNKQIDDIYNPNGLFEKANLIYNIVRERNDLVINNESKLEVIKNIIEDNPNTKIIIISKKGEFANKIYDYLNENNIKCGCYHDSIESQYVKDEYGNVITYKSGAQKGKPKVFCAKALSTLYLNAYNNNEINVLSIKNNVDSNLNCNAKIVIFTSPLCMSIKDFILRCNNVIFDKTIYTYIIYCENTSEYSKLQNFQCPSNVKIIEKEKNIEIDIENGDIIL